MTEKGKSSSRNFPSGLLRRIRRNRFWLLLYLWLALTVPVLMLSRGSGGSLFGVRAAVLPLVTLAPALTVFLVCTAVPVPQVNYVIALIVSFVPFLVCGIQLVWYRIYGCFLSFHALTDLSELFRYREALRFALYNAAPLLAGMGLPLLVLTTLGRRLFSFRPLKRWQQHIPMICACVLSHLLAVICLLPIQSPSAPLLPPEPAATEAVVSKPPEAVLLSGDASPNQLEIDFDHLAAEEERESVALIHRYFAGRTPSRKNSKTGLFRGCNLIQISAAISAPGEITEESAPTLHSMVQEGILLTDYHPAQGDYALLTGTISTGFARPELAADRYLPLTMVQQLIRQGYSAWALHCCEGGGCGEGGCLEAMGYECAVPRQKTSEALDRWAGELIDHSPFTGWCSFDSPLTLSELDAAMDLLVTRLKNTVIVLSLSFEDGSGLCVLRLPGTAPETVDSPTGTTDLLPTLSNLFGLSFDSRLYMGRDVFSEASPLVILPDGSWITDLTRYDAKTGQTTTLTSAPLSPGYGGETMLEVQRRMDISARILQEDYWRLLFP